jgi:hypothetical protein
MEDRWYAAAYHEAGHAIVAFYYGCVLGPIRIFEEHGRIRGEATLNRDSRYEPAIAASGRACAEAFGFRQTNLETADDDYVLAARLSERLTSEAEDTVLEELIDAVRRETALLFDRENFREAARALAERLLKEHQIDSDAAEQIIRSHVTRYLSNPPRLS